MLKKYRQLILIFFATVFLLFIGGPFFNYVATNKWELTFINSNNYDAWIGYYGAILGGSLTLTGVWWTIKDQNNKRREELAVQYRPILTFCESNVSFLSSLILLKLKLKNNGRGECSDVKISISSNDCIAILKNIPSSQICSDDSIPIEVSIFKAKKNINTTSKQKFEEINENDHFLIDVNIEYNDIFQNNYTKKYLFDIQSVITIPFSSKPNENIQYVFGKIKSANRMWICLIKDI